MSNKLSKEFTTITPFSKTLALILFILFPICAFFLGRWEAWQTWVGYNGPSQVMPTAIPIQTKPQQNVVPDQNVTLILQQIYQGDVSPIVPYKGLKFKEISVSDSGVLQGALGEDDYRDGDNVIDGYTFIATAGADYEFLAEETNASHLSFIETELYGYGPSVVRGETRIGWGVPATSRYFYIVKGSDFYGNNPENKFGSYTLHITRRK